MPVQTLTTRAISSSVTSWRKRLWRLSSEALPSAFVAAASFFSSAGIVLYFNSAAFSRLPSRVYFSSSKWAFSRSSFTLRLPSIASFSFCHSSFIASRFAVTSASSFSSFPRRSLLASSSSLERDCFSMASCMIFRSAWSSSTGWLSISILRRLAASSTRSMALSGRKRFVM